MEMGLSRLHILKNRDLVNKLRFYLLLFIVIFAVIFRGGNRPLPLMILELASVGLLLLFFLSPDKDSRIPGFLNKAIWALLFFPLLYLIPVPWEMWAQLPGRELYSQTLSIVDNSSFRSLSIYPLKTELAFLAIMPAVAVFFSSLRLSVRQLKILVLTLLGVAFFQAMLGLIQYGDGISSALRFGNPYASNGAEGTYANRNHLAGLLEMVLPISLGLLALSIGSTRAELRHHSGWRSQISSISGIHMNKSIIYGFLCIVLLLGIIFTQSRSGVFLAMLGILISAFAYARRLGGTNVFGVIGTFSAVVVAIAAEIGLAPLLHRFTIDHMSNLRFTIYENTIKGIGTFFPLGSGPGTYPYVYPRFQSIEEKGFVNHAHNDYLEWIMEGGLIAAIFILIFLFYFLRNWSVVWVSGYWSTFRFFQVGAGIGVLMIALHGFTDFNLHIPANVIYFSFLAAVFFYPYEEKEDVLPEKINSTEQNMGAGYPDKSEKILPDSLAKGQEAAHRNDKISPTDIPNPFSEDDTGKDD